MNISTTTRRPVSNRRHVYVMEHRILSMIVACIGLSLSLSSTAARAQLCPLPAVNPWCAALQTLDCMATAADETCLPREVTIDPNTGEPIIWLCDCFSGTGCGPVDITPNPIPPGGYTVSCPGACPVAGEECQVHFNGNPSGMSSVDSSRIPPFTNVTCACARPPPTLCPLPDSAECAALQSRDCPETEPATECLPKVIRHNVPPPPLFPSAGTDELSGTTGYVAIRSPSGQIMTYPIRESPPNTTRVMRESPVTYPEYHIIPTEIVAMELVGVAGGGGGGGAVMIRESPTRASLGTVVGAVSDTTDYPADSFFDLFVEIDIPDLGVYGLYNPQAIRLEARGIRESPPLGSSFKTPQGWLGAELWDAQGPTDYVIVEVVHDLPPPPPEWEVIECQCVDPTRCRVEIGQDFTFCDGFEDGNIADWTVTVAGGGVIAPTNVVAQAGLWSLEMKSPNSGDRADAVTPAVVADVVDFSRPYTVDFDFRVPVDDYHYFEVLAVNKSPALADSQVLLVMDTPGFNDLIWRDEAGNHHIAFLNRNQWYHFAVSVRPAAAQYDLLVDGGAVANVVNIPFARSAAGFTGARVGDRNDESGGIFFDYGRAFWDNVCIRQAQTTSPYCVGACLPGEECLMQVTIVDSATTEYECVCVPVQACCLPDGKCVEVESSRCLAMGGIPQGAGTSCTLVACPQPEACCCGGACEMSLPEHCSIIECFPQGPGRVCSLVPEPCCLPDGTCQMVDPLCCDEMGGTPSPTGKVCGRDDNRNGIDDSCEVYENQVVADDFSVSCPECKCDLNLDGICDENDRNFLISCSMPPLGYGCERADLDCNGFIDGGDLAILDCLLSGDPPPVECCPTPAPRPVINRLRWYGSYLDPAFEPPSIRQVDGWLVALHSDIPPVACPPPPDDTGAVDLCGTLKEGVEQGCILFGPDGSPFQYLVQGSVAPYGPGDRVRICGYYDPNCTSYCMQGIGCIVVQSALECDTGVSRPDRLLAQWLFPPKAVLEAPAGKFGCDLHQISSYVTHLSDGCLIHNFLATDEYDPLTGTFYPRPGVTYWISFQAEVGITANPVTDCLPSKTGNQVRNDFWGWHTTPPPYGFRDDAYAGRLVMGCPDEWLYDWKTHLHWSQPPYVYCADDPTASINMAFCLATREIGPVAERLWWCQPANPVTPAAVAGLGGVAAGIPSFFDVFRQPAPTIDTYAETNAYVVLNLYAMGQVEVLLRGPTAVDRKKKEEATARIETELVAMTLTGVSPLGPLTMREDAKRASFGLVTGGGGGGRIDSFFDVFFDVELTAEARTFMSAGPARVEAQIYEVPPAHASFILTNAPVLLVDQGTGTTVGELIYVQHNIGYRGGIDIQSDLDWTKVPTVPCCEPDPTGLGCNPVLLCPAHNQVCIPKAVFCTMPPPVLCTVVDCDCQNPDACHVELIDGVPRCVGTACAPGEVCNLSGTDTNGDGIVDRFVCGCEIPAVTPTGDPAPTAVDKNRHLSMVVPAVATAGPGPLTALRVTPIDLQHPIPANVPQIPPKNFTTFDTRLNGVCVGGTHVGHHCDTDADCRLCISGSGAGLPCTSNADCRRCSNDIAIVCDDNADCIAVGGSCGAAGTCPVSGGTCTNLTACTAAGEANGCARWVGKPGTYLEAQDFPLGATNRTARLQCTPFYHDWGSEGVFHVTGAEITPSSTYDVENLSASCLGTEDACAAVSPPLRLTTARSGDVGPNFNPPSTTGQPDVLDIAQVVNKLKILPGAPVKAIAQLQPNLPELNADVNALDIVAVVDGVKQFAYAYSGPCPCPSTVTCGSPGPPVVGTPCTTPTPCETAFGAGSMCVKTCNSGDNVGEPCINNTHCGKCLGGANLGYPCDANGDCPMSTCSLDVCGNPGPNPGYCRDRCGRCSP